MSKLQELTGREVSHSFNRGAIMETYKEQLESWGFECENLNGLLFFLNPAQPDRAYYVANARNGACAIWTEGTKEYRVARSGIGHDALVTLLSGMPSINYFKKLSLKVVQAWIERANVECTLVLQDYEKVQQLIATNKALIEEQISELNVTPTDVRRSNDGLTVYASDIAGLFFFEWDINKQTGQLYKQAKYRGSFGQALEICKK